ncbi:TagK domain-containing protein [Trinickia sp. YCB016]
MTGYYARWNIAPNEASKLEMYVGSVQFDGKLLPESERDQVSGGTLTLDASDTILSIADAGISVGGSALLESESFDDAVSPASENLAMVAAEDATASGDISAIDYYKARWMRSEIEASGGSPLASESSDDASSAAFDDFEPKHGAHAEEIETFEASPHEPSSSQLVIAALDADREPSLKTASTWSLEPSSEPAREPAFKSLPEADSSSTWLFEPSIEPTWTAPSEAPAELEQSPTFAAPAEQPKDEVDVVDTLVTLSHPSDDIEPLTSEPVADTASPALNNLTTVTAADATASADILAFDINEAISAAAEVAASRSAPLASELSDDANSDAVANIDAKHGVHVEEIETLDASLAASHDEPGVDAVAHVEHLNQTADEDTIEPVSETTTAHSDIPVSSAVYSAFEPFIEPSFEWPIAGLSSKAPEKPEQSRALADTASPALDNLATVSTAAATTDATASADFSDFDISEAILAAAEVAASSSAPLASELSDDASSDAFANIDAQYGAHAEEVETLDASVDATAHFEHLNQAAAEDTVGPTSETTTSLHTLSDAPASSAVHSAFEPFIEPSFEWPLAALSTESSREPVREPSSSQLVNAAPGADREPSLKATSAWSLDPSSEPASEPVFKSLSEADSSFVWPSEPSIEPTWAAPAVVAAEPEQPLAAPTAHPNDEAGAIATLANPSSEQTAESRDSDDEPASQSHADAHGAHVFETPSELAHGPEQFDTPQESVHTPEHASPAAPETNTSADASSTDIVPLAQPADFSDLIALAGPTLLDDHYHDHPSGGHKALALLGNGSNGGDMSLTFDDEEKDPLAALTAEYKQTLLHRTRGSSHELKNVSTENAPIVAPPNDPFTDMLRRRDDGSLLEDLLGSSRNIDAVLESLDEFGAEQIFEADERHEILSLLAPGNARSQLFPQPAMLARQEHHLISVDSHIQMVNSTHYDEQESNKDETQR